jgi:hypothetical protein
MIPVVQPVGPLLSSRRLQSTSQSRAPQNILPMMRCQPPGQCPCCHSRLVVSQRCLDQGQIQPGRHDQHCPMSATVAVLRGSQQAMIPVMQPNGKDSKLVETVDGALTQFMHRLRCIGNKTSKGNPQLASRSRRTEHRPSTLAMPLPRITMFDQKDGPRVWMLAVAVLGMKVAASDVVPSRLIGRQNQVGKSQSTINGTVSVLVARALV